MALSSSDEEGTKAEDDVPKLSSRKRKKASSARCRKPSANSGKKKPPGDFIDTSMSEEDEMGTVELRPPDVTSWKQKVSIIIVVLF